MPKKPVNYVRKRVDFYPDIEYDRNLIKYFFEKDRFLHPEMSNVPLSHSDVLKAALHYFYNSVVVEEQNSKKIAEKYKKQADLLKEVDSEKSEEIERLKSEISDLKEKTRPRHVSTMRREVSLE